MHSDFKKFLRLIWKTDEKQKKFIYFLVLLSFIIPLCNFPSNTTSGFQVIQSNSENVGISYFIDVKSYKTIITVEHEPIHLNSNNDFFENAHLEGWKGNGTETNPFLIQGYNFTNKNDLIRITNSNVYFQIKNCSLNGEGEGIGIVFTNVSNGYIIENVIYNNSIGIQLRFSSKENSISKNHVFNYTDMGIQLEEGSEFNVVKMNDFLNSNGNSTHARDNGFYNTLAFNFWSDYIYPDLNTDGIVDTPYSISGTSNNNDSYPLSACNPPTAHLLSKPRIIYPINKENLKGTVVLQWTESVDSFSQNVLYCVCFSKDYRIWKPLVSDIKETSYSLNTITLDDGSNYWFRILSSSSDESLMNEVFFGPFSIQNLFTPEIRLLATLILIAIAASILIGAIFRRKRASTIEKSIASHSDLTNLRLGVSYGSFTDDGLVIRGKSKKCLFDDQQLQSMLEYSAMLYQYGKVGDMYGPFPLTNGKASDGTSEIIETKWNYISLWIKMIDDTIEDLRIIKRTGEVPTGILLFFPKEFESIIMLHKEKITSILTKEFKKISKISEITTSLLNEIEDKVYARISL